MNWRPPSWGILFLWGILHPPALFAVMQWRVVGGNLAPHGEIVVSYDISALKPPHNRVIRGVKSLRLMIAQPYWTATLQFDHLNSEHLTGQLKIPLPATWPPPTEKVPCHIEFAYVHANPTNRKLPVFDEKGNKTGEQVVIDYHEPVVENFSQPIFIPLSLGDGPPPFWNGSLLASLFALILLGGLSIKSLATPSLRQKPVEP